MKPAQRTRFLLYLLLALAPLQPARADQKLDALVAASLRYRADATKPAFDAPRTRARWADLQQRLHEWIESRLPAGSSPQAASQERFEADLNAELRRVGVLAVGDLRHDTFGYVAPVKVLRPPGYPALAAFQAGFTVGCGMEESLLLYRFGPRGWTRLLAANGSFDWGSELMEPRWSKPAAGRDSVVFIGWTPVQCGSNWISLEYRLVNLGRDLERAEVLRSGRLEWVVRDSIQVAITPDELLLEYESGDITPGFRRTYVHRYRLGPASVDRIDPVALQPQDFVHEWLQRPWSEMASRSAKGLERWHRLLLATFGASGYYDLVQPCVGHPGFVQVGIEFDGIGKEKSAKPLQVFFLVQDRGEHSYHMVDANLTRQEGCPGDSQHELDRRPSLFKKP